MDSSSPNNPVREAWLTTIREDAAPTLEEYHISFRERSCHKRTFTYQRYVLFGTEGGAWLGNAWAESKFWNYPNIYIRLAVPRRFSRNKTQFRREEVTNLRFLPYFLSIKIKMSVVWEPPLNMYFILFIVFVVIAATVIHPFFISNVTIMVHEIRTDRQMDCLISL